MRHIASVCMVVVILACGCEPSSDAGRRTSHQRQITGGLCGTTNSDTAAIPPIHIIGSSPHIDSLRMGEPAGLAMLDSLLYAFDAADPAVRVFDQNLSYRGRFLRRGRGPGEMTPSRNRQSASIPDFIAPGNGNVLLVDYNAEQIVSFSPDGTQDEIVLKQFSRYKWWPLSHNRMRWMGDTLFFGGGAWFPLIPPGTKQAPVFHVRAVADGEVHSLAMTPVHPVPRTPSGAFMVGPAEAVPAWEITSSCILITDGHSPVVQVWDRQSGNVDSVMFTFPADVQVGYDFAPGRAVGPGLPSFPVPALIKKTNDITVGPDGVIWLQLAPTSARPASQLVLRIDPTSGEQRLDTLPAFPKVFMNDGTWYGLGYVEDETAVIWKGKVSITY